MTSPSLDELIEAGRFDEALSLASLHLKAARATGDDAALAEALLEEARAQLAHGDRDEAVMTVDEAISRARRSYGHQSARYAEALELGAEIAAAAAMPNAAEARFEGSIEILEKVGVAGAALAHALLHHGLFRLSEGDADGAVRAFAGVLERTVDAPGAEPFVAQAFVEMGFLALAAGRDPNARALGDRALEILLALGKARRFEVADGMTLVGIAALRQGEPEVAIEFLAPACEIYRGCKVDVRVRHGAAQHHLGLALAAAGKIEEARAALRAAIDLYREGSDERLLIEQRLLELARQ
ncbi:MAG: tetratricopeptide repeat protein [Myxococcales bacterium]|nr:tetratricopeptide repeat protein [Myxococcales bacterium]